MYAFPVRAYSSLVFRASLSKVGTLIIIIYSLKMLFAWKFFYEFCRSYMVLWNLVFPFICHRLRASSPRILFYSLLSDSALICHFIYILSEAEVVISFGQKWKKKKQWILNVIIENEKEKVCDATNAFLGFICKQWIWAIFDQMVFCGSNKRCNYGQTRCRSYSN